MAAMQRSSRCETWTVVIEDALASGAWLDAFVLLQQLFAIIGRKQHLD